MLGPISSMVQITETLGGLDPNGASDHNSYILKEKKIIKRIYKGLLRHQRAQLTNSKQC